MTGAAPVAGVLLGTIALLGGYLVGSLPAARRIGRMAGVDLGSVELSRGGPDAVWRAAGPGWGFLALTADLAKGVLPVAIGVVTFSWPVGWVAGLGAVLGACWPAFGRAPGERGVATLAGAAFTLAPPAGTLSVLLGLGAFAVGRGIGRDGRTLALAVGFGSYPVLLLLVQQDLAMLAALLALYLVAGLRAATIPRQ